MDRTTGHLWESEAEAGIALIGNSPPRRCGIATFTDDCFRAMRDRFPDMRVDYFAMDDGADRLDYPDHVRTILADDLGHYIGAGLRIEQSDAAAIWLQHEFGIFGGDAGEYILELLAQTAKPVIATLHTVLEQPSADQERVFRALVERASHLIVMAERGKAILQARYGVRPSKVSVIPHGVPDRPFKATAEPKAALGLDGRKLLLTFGLLAPDKGIGSMIEAMPAIIEKHPDALYLVLGATHPNLARHEGERLRHGLMRRADELGVGAHVRFAADYLDLPELLDHVQAADIYVTPYLNPAQVVSGTLSYAVAMGKPVVSTPYVHAREILSDDHGILVPFADSAGLATAITGLFDDETERARLARRAYARGRSMLWSLCAERVGALIGRLSGEARAPSLSITSPATFARSGAFTPGYIGG
ncbi:glycosyltransferase family 4 protein [Sphingomonas sp. PR090111-T3T-6A]|uniref:glycosyltransferase family 4 protein n=1 Tax=Sphingomonas sp. PR090111-T3T-6A TaxID=685778 RepID=UPI00039E299A|nr:glycosyltransferase family 4 protein [Sphingomonas sp. PR090111-T3T-6A]